MDSNPICHPSPAKKMKCSFLDYIQILMISWASQWTWTPSATSLQPKKWNAHFWITFHFWWSARLVDGLEPHLPPLSSLKIKCSFLHYIQLLKIGRVSQWTQTPSAIPLQPKKWKACFWITLKFLWSAGLVDGLKPHLPPLSSQKNEILIFGLHSTSDDQLGWLMDGRAGWWTQTLSTTSLQPKNEILVFGLCSTSDDQPGWLKDSNPICHPSPAKKMKCLFLDYIQLLMIGWADRWMAGLVDGLKPHPPPLCSQKYEMLVFGLSSNSDDRSG